TSLVAASSGSENLEISIYNTLPFVKVNPWYFSFFPQKSELHFGNLPRSLYHYTKIIVPYNGLCFKSGKNADDFFDFAIFNKTNPF
ncbi:MAG: hypothetical protein MR981_00005, partial [Ruminococcus bromii]|nr:hypothetical protein [Ruminococcus bromii]